MIGSQRKTNNPILRRLSRHTNLSILFKKSEPGLAGSEYTSLQKSAASLADYPIIQAHLWQTPVEGQIEPIIEQIPTKTAVSTQPSHPRLIQTFPSEPLPQPTSLPTPSAQGDPIWRRLQTIMRKHAEKQPVEENKSHPPVQEFIENKPQNDSHSDQQPPERLESISPAQVTIPQVQTSQKTSGPLPVPAAEPQEDQPLTKPKIIPPLPEQVDQQPKRISTSTELPQSAQPSKSLEVHEKTSAANASTPEQIQHSIKPTPAIQTQKVESTPPIKLSQSTDNSQSQENFPSPKIAPEDTSLHPQPVTQLPLEPTIIPQERAEEIPTENENQQSKASPFNPPAQKDIIQSKPVEEPAISPMKSEESLPQFELPQPQSIPLEKAWPVESKLSPATAQLSPAVVAGKQTIEPSESFDTSISSPTQQNIVTQILKEVTPAQPTDSSIEIISPRQPRPLPLISKPVLSKKEETDTEITDLENRPEGSFDTNNDRIEPVFQTSKTIATEIGALPADLWHLIGEKPPVSKTYTNQSPNQPLQKSTETIASRPENKFEDQQLFDNRPQNEPIPVKSTGYSSEPESKLRIDKATPAQSIQRQAEAPAATTQSQEAGTSGGEGEEDKKKEAELKELVQKVYLEIRKRIAIENERFRLR